MAAVLSDVLKEEQVILDLRAETRDEALREIIATMAPAAEDAPGVDMRKHVPPKGGVSARPGVDTGATGAGLFESVFAEKFLSEVLAREEVHSTYMVNGVAFPHARTDLVEQIVLGVGRTRSGVAFGEEGEKAHLLFVIAVPRRMVNDYLVCVGALARVVNDAETRAALMNCENTAEFVELIRAASLLLE